MGDFKVSMLARGKVLITHVTEFWWKKVQDYKFAM
jgi:hypothetical protein